MKILPFLKSQIFLYAVFGVLTTAVNVVSFRLLRLTGIPLEAGVAAAWILSVLFAFFTNRKYVFRSGALPFPKELAAFFAARIFSGAADFLLMHFLGRADFMDETALKILVNIVVVALNFFLSKFFVFSGKKDV